VPAKPAAPGPLPLLLRDAAVFVCALAGVYLLIALISYDPRDAGWSTTGSGDLAARNLAGVVGAWLADFCLSLLGYMAYPLPFLSMAWTGRWARALHRRGQPAAPPGRGAAPPAPSLDAPWVRGLGALLFLLAGAVFCQLLLEAAPSLLPGSAGGILGALTAKLLLPYIGALITLGFSLAVALAGLTLATGLSWLQVFDRVGALTLLLFGWAQRAGSGGWRAVVQTGDWLARMLKTRAARRAENRQRAEAALLVQAQERQRVAPVAAAPIAPVPVPAAPAPVKPVPLRPGPVAPIAPSPMSTASPVEAPIPRPATPTLIEPVLRMPEPAPLMPTAGATPQRREPTLPPLEPLPPEPAVPALAPAPLPPRPAPVPTVEHPTPPPPSPPPSVRAMPMDAPMLLDTAIDPVVPLPPVAPFPVAAVHLPPAPRPVAPAMPPPAAAPRPLPLSDSPPIAPGPQPIQLSERAVREAQSLPPRDPGESLLPPLALLDEPRPTGHGYTDAMLETLSRQVEEKLRDFRIEVKVVGVYPGPVITRFELQLAPGIRASQISSLDNDIARGLSVVSVRVVEVIPGKSVVGLEIPNARREIVVLKEIVGSREYEASKSPLTLALGKDIGGRPVVADIGRMPHLLVAGTTGSGKSVALNAMILSLLYKATAEDVRMIMIDPKMLELSMYEGIPHLLAPVVTDMKQAANALRWCVAEMERRYRLMAAVGVRNLAGYNRTVREHIEAGRPLLDPLFDPTKVLEFESPQPLEPMPYLVVIIDEFADMMMVVGKKVEELIARLAQKARASGIHLILATQRPTVDVITGLIKSNVPGRIAFQVSSKTDSRTIIDKNGAETLLGHGDMLFMAQGSSIPERAHGAFVDDHEVSQVVHWLKEHTERPVYIDAILDERQELADGRVVGETGLPEEPRGEGSDALYDMAVRVVTESRRASISLVQRQLRIGYNRAARLVEEMEQAGIVSAPNHQGNREVLAPPPPSG